MSTISYSHFFQTQFLSILMYYIVKFLILANVVCSSSLRRLMVSDTKVDSMDHPHVVALLFCREPNVCASFCSGSLISATVVLTAGHCVYDQTSPFNSTRPPVPMNKIFVLVGASSSGEISRSQMHGVVRAENAGFGLNLKYPLDNDLGLLFLDTPVQGVPFATLASVAPVPSCEPITSVGFGAHTVLPSEIAFNDGHLREIQSQVHTYATCVAEADLIVKDMQFCHGGNSVETTCNGDSGGPVMDAAGVQIGITSFGASRFCGGSPNFATSVARYVPWITAKMAGIPADPPAARCARGQWQCALSGECISESLVCDTTRNCSDGSDEDVKYCEAIVYSNHFRRLQEEGFIQETLLDEFDTLLASRSQIKFASSNEKIVYLGMLGSLDDSINLLRTDAAVVSTSSEDIELCPEEVNGLISQVRFEKTFGHNRAESDPSEILEVCLAVKACLAESTGSWEEWVESQRGSRRTAAMFCDTFDKFLIHNATRDTYAHKFDETHNITSCPANVIFAANVDYKSTVLYCLTWWVALAALVL